MRVKSLRFLVVLAFASPPLAAQSNACSDLGAHEIRMIETAPGVTIEVLDWGGDGPPLVLLAGLGNTGHVFDDFAMHFSPEFRVLAVTRRGYGESSRPADGYDADTRARDLLSVLDQVGIARASFAGHSIAGDELSKLGAVYADRVDRLVYLDAYAYGPEVMGTFATAPDVPAGPSSARDTLSPAHRQAGQARRLGYRFPIGEICAPRGSQEAAAAIRVGTHTVAFEDIAPPALGLFAGPRSIESAYPDYSSYDSDLQEAVRIFLNNGAIWRTSQYLNFDGRMQNSELLVIQGAAHYVFMSDEGRVVEEMLEFLP